MTNLTIQFPTEAAMKHFAEWLCDGGEQDFFASCEIHIPNEAIARMQYSSENPAFAQNDKRRYGRFLADNLIIAHAEVPSE